MSPDTPTPDNPATTAVPLLAGRYQVLEQLGQGGMGTVFRARDAKLDRPVALKMLPQGSAPDADAVARFKREAKALARLSHAGIIQAYDSGEEGGRPFLVMELVEGRSLAAVLREQGRVAPARAADFAYQAALALQHAHQHGLVHRDVKPSNLLLSADGRVRLLDLGLARFLQDQIGEAQLTRTGTGMGTPDYCPPEQLRDARKADARSDVYSLGCTLYHLIAGRVPFPGSSFSEKVEAHETKEPTPLEELCPEAPVGLALVVRRMMAKRPAGRFAGMAEVAEALMPHVAGSSASSPEIRNSATWDGSRLATTPALPPRRHHVAWIVAGAAGAVLLMAGVVGFFGLAAGWFRPGGAQVAGLLDTQPEATPKLDTHSDAHPAQTTADDPDVLTVSQKKEDRGKYRTIGAALEDVQPGQTIRVLDDGVYAERVVLTGAGKYARLTLEAPRRATLEIGEPGNLIDIHDVPGVVLRGFRLRARTSQAAALLFLVGHCAGTELDGVDFAGQPGARTNGLQAIDASPGGADETSFVLDVHDCTFRNVSAGCVLAGINVDYATPTPVEGVRVRGNDFMDLKVAVYLLGEVRKVQVVGNRAQRMSQSGVQLERLLSTTDKVLIANNTFLDGAEPIRVWDGQITLTGVAIRNNLILSPAGPDMVYLDSGGNPREPRGPGDGPRLSNTWTFSHNWREAQPPTGKSIKDKGWIPPRPGDTLSERIDRVNRDPKSPDFLRPAKDSPLATEGAGNEDPSLPRYVGALPPEGAEPWDWDRAWRMPKDAQLLTVSNVAGGDGKYRTISDALKDARPWATVRVLDNAEYGETLLLDRKEQEGICVDALRGATLSPGPNEPALTIASVPNVQVRGLGVRGHAKGRRGMPLILVRGAASGVVLEGLRLQAPMTEHHELIGIVLQDTQAPPEHPPLTVRRCDIRVGFDGIHVVGTRRPGKVAACAGLRIENNRVAGPMARGIWVGESVARIQVAGNTVWDCEQRGLQVQDLSPESRGILLANNTVRRCPCLLCAWQGENAGPLAAGQVEVQNNLLLEATGSDIAMMRGLNNPGDPHELARLWRFAHNGRDLRGVEEALQVPLQGTDVHMEKPPFATTNAPDRWRPAADSPLAHKGAGPADPSLPAYIGALPPEGTEPWDWDRTWRARMKKADEKR
jgi:nitrous oxidase accessory protein NosD